MARGKTKIARIEDNKILNSTFKKRKNGLIKKIQELTILCDIIACVIIYAPVIGNRPPEIFTWPEDQEKVRAAIRMYHEKQEHYKRTAELCNILKNRRRLDMSESDHHQHQVNCMTLSGGGFYEKEGMSTEAALAYLNWVEARIKAVDERIEFVTNSGNMMMFGNDCHNVMFDDDKKMLIPVQHLDQNRNFGYGFLHQNPYVNFAQFDPYVFDQTMHGGGRGGYSSNQSHFQQSIIDHHHHQQQIQIPNQMCSYDPYFSRMSINNSSMCYQQQQCLSSVTQTHYNDQHLMQLCPYLDEWLSSDGASSSSSNQLNKSAAAAVAEAVDDPLDYFLNTSVFIDELQPLEDAAAAAGGNVPNQKVA